MHEPLQRRAGGTLAESASPGAHQHGRDAMQRRPGAPRRASGPATPRTWGMFHVQRMRSWSEEGTCAAALASSSRITATTGSLAQSVESERSFEGRQGAEPLTVSRGTLGRVPRASVAARWDVTETISARSTPTPDRKTASARLGRSASPNEQATRGTHGPVRSMTRRDLAPRDDPRIRLAPSIGVACRAASTSRCTNVARPS